MIQIGESNVIGLYFESYPIEKVYVGEKLAWEVAPSEFSKATPAQIKYVFDKDMVPTTWKVGDEHLITLTDGSTYTLQLLDKTRSRYPKATGGASNCVIGFKEIILKAPMNSTDTNVGGWGSCLMRTSTMQQIYDKIPAEWKKVISKVKVASSLGGGNTQVELSENFLFLPALTEVAGPNPPTSHVNEGPQFEYYKTATMNDRIKYYKGTASYWWLRGPSPSNSQYFQEYADIGVVSGGHEASVSQGVSPCFAI